MIEFYFYDFTDLSLGRSPILTSNKETIPSFSTDKLLSIVLMLIHCDFISFVTKCSGVAQPAIIRGEGPSYRLTE